MVVEGHVSNPSPVVLPGYRSARLSIVAFAQSSIPASGLPSLSSISCQQMHIHKFILTTLDRTQQRCLFLRSLNDH
jgi:hypothetical protein